MTKIFAALVLVLSISGCSFMEPGTQFPGISNRGIIPVSTTNAHVGSNLFLSEQMEKSPELYSFMAARGAPHAIRVFERPNRSPEMVLYYPRENAFYVGELISDRKTYNWIVRGPNKIPSYEQKALSSPAIDIGSEPLLVFFNRLIRLRAPLPQATLKTIPEPKLPELPVKETPSKASKAPSRPAKKSPTPKTPEFKPLNTDQMAILMSQGFAERDKNGDVIHTVKSADETIEEIAKWYTNSATNSGAILKATGLDQGSALPPGTRIRVPLKLVKNTKQMKK